MQSQPFASSSETPLAGVLHPRPLEPPLNPLTAPQAAPPSYGSQTSSPIFSPLAPPRLYSLNAEGSAFMPVSKEPSTSYPLPRVVLPSLPPLSSFNPPDPLPSFEASHRTSFVAPRPFYPPASSHLPPAAFSPSSAPYPPPSSSYPTSSYPPPFSLPPPLHELVQSTQGNRLSGLKIGLPTPPASSLLSSPDGGKKRIRKPGHWPCPIAGCGKVFKQKVHLLNHNRVHTGEKPFVCGVCGHAFSQEVNLNTHKRVHSKTEMRCNICGLQFATLPKLIEHNAEVHQRVKHEEEEPEKDEKEMNQEDADSQCDDAQEGAESKVPVEEPLQSS